MFVTSFYLSPKYRGGGIGSEAFTLLMEMAKAEGFEKIVLSVDSTNTYAIEFYKKFGLRTEMMYMSKLLKDVKAAAGDESC